VNTDHQIILAVQLPVEISARLDQLPTKSDNCEIAYNLPPKKEGTSTSYTFDPATGMEFVWVALKVVGVAAEAVAAKTIAEIIYKWLRDRHARALKTVRIRFPTGEICNLEIDDPDKMKQLHNLIADRARQ